MQLFLSWSGDESRQIAEALRDWLPMLFESVEPYMSARDNEAGVRWAGVIATRLDEGSFGILCLTPTNLTAPWLLFEAGALGKSVDASRVVPLLWSLSPADVTSPLNQFHMKAADKAGIHDVVKSINASLDKPRPDDVLEGLYGLLWPRLEEKLQQVRPPTAGQSAGPHRTDRQLLEEILEIARSTRQESSATNSRVNRAVREERRRIVARSFASRLTDLLPTNFRTEFREDAKGMSLIVFPPPGTVPGDLEPMISRMSADGRDIGVRLRVMWPPDSLDTAEDGSSGDG